jgi:hypothetical protein
MTKTLRAVVWVNLFLLAFGTETMAQTAPSAPALLSASSAASVQIPFAISWSSVSDPAGIVAYNWFCSRNDDFD